MSTLKAPASCESMSLRDIMEALDSGLLDDYLDSRPRKTKRKANRITRTYRFAKRNEKTDEFFDELSSYATSDSQCCLMAPALSDANFDEYVSLGLGEGQFFEFLDALIERAPAILEVILMFVQAFAMFAAILLCITFAASSASAETLPPSSVYTPVKVTRTVSITRTNPLAALIPARGTVRTYATIEPYTSAALIRHLTTPAPDHEFTYTHTDLAGLTREQLWMLHNLNHSSLAIAPVRTVRSVTRTVSPVASGDCPNGQCNRTRTITTSRPGLLGRLFGR